MLWNSVCVGGVCMCVCACLCIVYMYLVYAPLLFYRQASSKKVYPIGPLEICICLN